MVHAAAFPLRMEQLTKSERQSAISVAHLSKSLGGQKIIDDVSFEIDAGEMLVVLGRVGQMNIPALFITHDQEEALGLADRIVALNHGRIEQIGAPYEVYNRPRNEFVATFLGAANVLLGRWVEGKVTIGSVRLKSPPDAPLFSERQPVKVIFRPEDVVLNFQPQLLDTPYVLGRAVIEDVSYIGHSERLVARLMLWARQGAETAPDAQRQRALSLADDSQADGFPVVITRNKWDATDNWRPATWWSSG